MNKNRNEKLRGSCGERDRNFKNTFNLRYDMKKNFLMLMLLFLASIFVSKAYAGINDLLYFPKEKSFFIETALWSNTSKSTYYDERNDEIFNSREKSLAGSLLVGYAINNIFYIAIDSAYSFYSREYRSYSSGYWPRETTVNSKGLYDPYLYLGFRLLNDKKDSITLDLTGIFSPGLQKAKYATEEEKGTMGRGGNIYGTDIGIGKHFGLLSLAGHGSFLLMGNRDYDDYKIVSGHVLEGSFDVQYNVTRFVDIALGFYSGYVLKSRLSSDLGYSNYKETNEGYQYYGFNIGMGVTIIKESLYAGVSFIYEEKTDNETKIENAYPAYYKEKENNTSRIEFYVRIQL